MKTVISNLILWVCLMAGSLCPFHARGESGQPESSLTNGMLLTRFEAILGGPGEMLPQPAINEARYEFDLDGRCVVADVRTHPKPEIVKSFRIVKDNKSASQRKAERHNALSGAVIRPHREATNQLPNKPARAPGDPRGAP